MLINDLYLYSVFLKAKNLQLHFVLISNHVLMRGVPLNSIHSTAPDYYRTNFTI
jgi:hypothetical protein